MLLSWRIFNATLLDIEFVQTTTVPQKQSHLTFQQ